MNRAEIGQLVSGRLKANPAAMKLPSRHLDIFVVQNFLTPRECALMIKMIDKRRQPSGVLGGFAKNDPDYRTSESCNVNPADPFVASIERKITELMGIDPSHGETIQGQRYAVGQQFKAHHDFFYTEQPYWQDMARSGGQRTWTTMMFLNDVEAGGQTFFPHANLRIAPRAGNLLTWNNMDVAGAPNIHSLHQGLAVGAGVKNIITKWYRESPWIPL